MFDNRVDQLVYGFNCEPLRYIDPSWLDEHERTPVERLADTSDARAAALCSAWLLERLGLQDSFDFDFTHASKRLLLLDAPAFRDMTLLLGLSSLVPALRTWVMRSQQLRLREAVGSDVFDFFMQHVLPRAPAVRWQLAESHAAQITAPAPLLHLAAWRGALLLLGGAAAAEPSPRRARLKLPRLAAEVNRTRALSVPLQRSVTDFCIDCVIRERYPTWHWLF